MMPPPIFIGAAADAATHFYRCRRPPATIFYRCRLHAGSFPFPREKGSEKGSQKSVGGVCRKTRLLPEVWLEVWLLGLQRIQGASVSPRAEFCIKALAAFIVP